MVVVVLALEEYRRDINVNQRVVIYRSKAAAAAAASDERESTLTLG